MGSLSFLTDIGKEFANEVGAFFGVTIFDPSLGFPTITDYNNIYSSGLGQGPNKPFSGSYGFGFGVLDNGQIASQWKQFKLQINPQEFQQDEEFSIQFFPTPTGITIEHQGSIMKDIVLSGTTGIHPKKGAGGIDIKGDIIFGVGDSGYKQFHDLRNYIRSYAEHKKNPSNKNLQLAFFNFKDQEFFLVEPVRFSLKRSSTKPMMYDYTIALKTVGRTEAPPDDSNIFENIFDAVNFGFELVANTINVSLGIINGSMDLLLQIDSDIKKKIIDPLYKVSNAISAYQDGSKAIIDLPKKFIEELNAACKDISDKLATNSGVPTNKYEMFKSGKTASVINSTSETTTTTPTYEEQKLLNAFDKTSKALSTLTFDNTFFSQTNDDTVDSINEMYGQTVVEKSNSVKSVKLQDGDTLQSLAAKYLGDGSQIQSIAIVNNLKYPYIASDEEIAQIKVDKGLPPDAKLDGVLSFNDKILIPQSVTVEDGISGVVLNDEYAITANLPQVEKALGVDIKLGVNKDIAITNGQDFDLVAGSDNVVQSVGIKMGVEKGSYELHKALGVDLGIGNKNTFIAPLLRQEIENQLLQDSRIQKGTRVQVRVEGNKILVTIYLKIKSSEQAMPLQLVSTQ